jgi:hypothetical protein
MIDRYLYHPPSTTSNSHPIASPLPSRLFSRPSALPSCASNIEFFCIKPIHSFVFSSPRAGPASSLKITRKKSHKESQNLGGRGVFFFLTFQTSLPHVPLTYPHACREGGVRGAVLEASASAPPLYRPIRLRCQSTTLEFSNFAAIRLGRDQISLQL